MSEKGRWAWFATDFLRRGVSAPCSGYGGDMVMWASDNRAGKVREGLTLLLSQGLIDDFEIRPDDEHPYRVTMPVGVIPLTEHQAAHFLLGAVTARFGPLARSAP